MLCSSGADHSAGIAASRASSHAAADNAAATGAVKPVKRCGRADKACSRSGQTPSSGLKQLHTTHEVVGFTLVDSSSDWVN